MPKVSIILPTFRRNESGRLHKAIDSALHQTLSDFELFIVDDGSTDGSSDTILQYCQQDPRVKHIRFEQNVGLPALTTARAFRQSSGEFIAWMFDDCEWEPNYLAEMIEIFDGQKDAGIAYAKCEAHFAHGSELVGEQLDVARLEAGGNHIPNGSTIIRRDVFYAIGWYDPRVALVRNNDWDFLRRAIRSGVKFLYVPKVLTHEYGVALPDSLGNSYDTNFELVDAIASADRRDELHPDRVECCDIISLPKGVSLTRDLLDTYLRILVEFAIKGGREALLKHIMTSEIFVSLGDRLSSQWNLLKWWGNTTTEYWRKEVISKDAHIQEQIIYIENQHAYIEKQHSEIHKRDAIIQNLPRLILAFVRRKVGCLIRRVLG